MADQPTDQQLTDQQTGMMVHCEVRHLITADRARVMEGIVTYTVFLLLTKFFRHLAMLTELCPCQPERMQANSDVKRKGPGSDVWYFYMQSIFITNFFSDFLRPVRIAFSM